VTLTFETDDAGSLSVLTAAQPRHIRPQTRDEFPAEQATGGFDPLGDLTWTMEATGNPMLSQGGQCRIINRSGSDHVPRTDSGLMEERSQ
jgi:hypothetical protein